MKKSLTEWVGECLYGKLLPPIEMYEKIRLSEHSYGTLEFYYSLPYLFLIYLSNCYNQLYWYSRVRILHMVM